MGAAKSIDQPTKSKRSILIRDDLYARVAYEASLNKMHTGEVVDLALAAYFKNQGIKI